MIKVATTKLPLFEGFVFKKSLRNLKNVALLFFSSLWCLLSFFIEKREQTPSELF
jgi:hypothetical protein